MTSRVRGEEGSTIPLVIGFGVLALVLVLVVAAASSLYLERKRLFTLADGAALVGAEAFDLADVTATPDGLRAELEPAEVRAAVSEYLAGTATGSFEALALESATSLDGRSATVTLSAIWRPPVVTVLFPEGLRIETTALARSVFG